MTISTDPDYWPPSDEGARQKREREKELAEKGREEPTESESPNKSGG